MRFLIGLFLLPLTLLGAGNFYNTPSTLNFTNQPGWSTPFGQLVGNVTEDYNYCRIPITQGSITGLVTLASPLAAGTYRMFAYGAAGQNSSPNPGGGVMTVTSGSSSNSLLFQVGAPSLYVNMQFVLSGTTSILPLVFSNRFLGSGHMDYWIKKIYITDNLDEFPASDAPNAGSIFLDWKAPPTNAVDLITFNYLPNSSFELGCNQYGYGWTRQQTPSSGAQRFYMNEGVTSEDAFEGTKSFEFGTNHASFQLYFPPIRLRGTNCFRPYTFSFYAKASTAGLTINGRLGHAAGISPNGTTNVYPHAYSNNFQFANIATTWTRYQTNLYFSSSPSCDLYGFLSCSPGLANNVKVDALMFQEGTMASTWEPAYPVEFALDSRRANGVFNISETTALDLITYNYTASSANRSFNLQAFNWRNAMTTNGSNIAITASAGVVTNTVTIANPSNGTSRVVIWTDDAPGLRNELIFTRAALTNAVTGNFTNRMGVQGNYFDGAVRSNNIYGFTWDRTVSPGSIFRWATIEPSSNNFTWTLPDFAISAITNVSTNRIIFGSLFSVSGSTPMFPAHAVTNGVPRLDRVFNYVTNVVRRYKPWVHIWEAENEPTVTAAVEALILEQVILAIKEADPTALIVGPNVALGYISSDSFLTNVWDALTPGSLANLWGASVHIYPNNQVDYMDPDRVDYGRFRFFKATANRYGKVILETESGDVGIGPHKTDMIGVLTDGSPDYDHVVEYQFRRESVERAMRNRLEALGLDYRVVFYHEARLGDLTYAQQSQQYKIYDEDDTMRPMGAAWMFINNLNGYATTATQLTNSSTTNIYGFLFQQGALKTIWTWNAERGTNRMVTVTNAGLTVWDLQGNRLQTGLTNIIVNKRPQAWTSTTLTSNQMAQMFINAFSTTSIADSNAPLTSVDKTLSGHISARHIPYEFRWCSMHSTWLNVDRYPDVVQTRFKIVGLSNNWSDWSAIRRVRLTALPPAGTYYLAVQARTVDNLATNEVAGPLFSVGESMPPPGLSGKAFLGGKIAIK